MLINKSCVSFDYIKLYSISSYKIAIPIFQRFYDWKEKQIIETLNDITNALENKDKEIYLLDFIWYEEDGMMKIADGQQRLVSLNIFMKAINDFIDENELSIDKIPLFHIKYDNFSYDKKYQSAFNNYMIAPFKKMYVYLREYVRNNSDRLEEIINILKERIYIYIKKTANSDDAFTIFTQINTGGKPLSKDEVIKTAIDQYSLVYGVNVNSNIKELRKTIAGYYKYIYSSAGKDFDTIAVMGFIKEYIVKDKNTFKEFVNYLDIVSKISDYSISYIIQYINRPQLFDILNIMAMKGIDVRVKKDYINYVMFPLCLLSIVMTMKKSNPGGIIKSLYASVIDDLKDDVKPNEICAHIATFINDNSEICKISYCDFEDSLGKRELSTKVKEAILIMDVISRTTSSDLVVPSINLEHVYPQKPAPEWAMHGWPTDKEEQYILIHNIGNYLLLNEEVNKKIKNKYITMKLDEYKRIIPKDIALQTQLNTIDFNSFEHDRDQCIFERQKSIAKHVYDNFVLASVIITNN